MVSAVALADDRGEKLAMCADVSIAVSAALHQEMMPRYSYVILVLKGRRTRVFQNLRDC